MAVAGVFWNDAPPASHAELLEALRLSPGHTPSIDSVIDDQLQRVRIGLYRRLGADRITTLLATAYVENPTTDAQLNRVMANQAESLWLRLSLMRVLPQMWMDDSSSAGSAWNEDAFSRESVRIESLVSDLEGELEDLLNALEVDDLDAEAEWRFQTISPTEPFKAGKTVYGSEGIDGLL